MTLTPQLTVTLLVVWSVLGVVLALYSCDRKIEEMSFFTRISWMFIVGPFIWVLFVSNIAKSQTESEIKDIKAEE
jgi:preprotein translocase subunit SecG